MKSVLHVVGARPNFMKVAPIWRALAKQSSDVAQCFVHTGQHYGAQMSDVFFADLGLPEPDVHLGVGSGSHAEQTARVMVELEKVLLARAPSLVSVVGDVNSTLAAALVAAKLLIPLAHVEAGLRSFDRTMPEEVNRLVTDRLSDLLLTPSADADENLLKEGTDPSRIFRVGNVMIDSLFTALQRAQQLDVLARMHLSAREYAVCTLHRPSNVDDPAVLTGLMGALAFVGEQLPVIFPVHPRTRKALAQVGLTDSPGIRLVEPMGYLEFLCLHSQAKLVLTDSGGLQEETTALKVPCLTLRENTERPITWMEGSNVLVGIDPARIRAAATAALSTQTRSSRVPALWDGHAAERIASVYRTFLKR